MTRPRDTQRSKLYTAERVLYTSPMADLRDVQAYVDKLCQQRWFQSRWGQRTIRVKDGRGRRSACAYGGDTIVMPTWSRFPSVILHEVAHLLLPKGQGYAVHGREFAGILVFLIRQQLGTDKGNVLTASFSQHRVKWNLKGVPSAGSRQVVTQTERAAAASARRKARLEHPVSRYEREIVTEVLRRAVHQGTFGPAGRKPRAHALEIARLLEVTP